MDSKFEKIKLICKTLDSLKDSRIEYYNNEWLFDINNGVQKFEDMPEWYLNDIIKDLIDNDDLVLV